MPSHEFIPEAEACKIFGYVPEVFRKKVKKGIIPIAFFAPTQRKYLYSKTDIEKYINKNATILR